MSCFIKNWFYCIDDFFWHRKYWYVKMNEEELRKQKLWYCLWNDLDFKTLEWRWWVRKVYNENELKKLIKNVQSK